MKVGVCYNVGKELYLNEVEGGYKWYQSTMKEDLAL